MHSPICLRLLRYVKTDASIIESTALRRFPDASRARARVYAYARQGPGTRVSPAPGYPGSSPRDNRGGISRVTDVTLRVTRVALTLSEICAGRYLSSWRFRTGLSWPQRFSSTRRPKEKKKKKQSIPSRVNDAPPRIRFDFASSFLRLRSRNTVESNRATMTRYCRSRVTCVSF